MKRKPTLVVALGGNALLKRGEPLEADIQRQNIDLAARTIAALTEQWNVVLVHGNGPQVGLLALQNSAYDKVTPYPLDILGAESQGMIGYMLQQALKNRLPQREVSVLLTQVEVDAADPAFRHPTKYIGPVYNNEQAAALQQEKGWTFKADGHYVRRVVPSPQPKRIVESDAIAALIQREHLVICNGGGGVPVVENANGYHGVEAVIDKDLSAALLARQIEADALLILTDADAVYLDWGKPTQRPLAQISPEVLQGLSFDAGSMGPKVAACSQFVEACNGIAGIGALADGLSILSGDKGTLIRH
ncbi:carbamate kinase [Kosakonia oryzendophytica]|uniref:Carbamate kinase n=1 Tax=Kosakonia oryzendophytica TaxID=1005665 RepID=A0A1C3ZZ03_9ENTR|nr:carbamate kinase [Kosakonia oryzendophytica]AMO50817.1 Carbamate kinase [Enterobacter sp. FY-07]TDT52443.1 carbamate kinase [Enterobacter sp. AG5470]WBT57750.1 carbamate kinase [Kosakonia oryzendophytica]SCB87430.1 carbamate kinase [Kosakonia oryzendophytica]